MYVWQVMSLFRFWEPSIFFSYTEVETWLLVWYPHLPPALLSFSAKDLCFPYEPPSKEVSHGGIFAVCQNHHSKTNLPNWITLDREWSEWCNVSSYPQQKTLTVSTAEKEGSRRKLVTQSKKKDKTQHWWLPFSAWFVRRPEITIVSAEPLGSNRWFSRTSVILPPPPPPPPSQAGWSAGIQDVSQVDCTWLTCLSCFMQGDLRICPASYKDLWLRLNKSV